MVGSSTGRVSRPSARVTSASRSSRSSAGERSGSPRTLTIARPRTMRLAPTDCASASRALTWATGIPATSSSLASAAPPRLHDPHVDVKMTPSTPVARRSPAISCAKRRMVGIDDVFPTVVYSSL